MEASRGNKGDVLNMMFHGLGQTCAVVDPETGDCMAYTTDDPLSSIPIGSSNYGTVTSTNSPSGVDAPTFLSTQPGGTTALTPSGQLVSLVSGQVIAPSGSAATGFNWGSFLAAVTPAALTDATKLTSQAIATPGTVLLPNGTIAVGTSAGTSSLTTALSSLSSSSLLPLLLLGGVVVWLVVKK